MTIDVISLFCGAGGSCEGYKQAGCNVIAGVDNNRKVLDVYACNHPKSKPIFGDLSKVTANKLLNACSKKKGELDILDSSSPCPGVSMVGQRIHRKKKTPILEVPSNKLFFDNIRLIGGIMPKVFILENVTGQYKGIMRPFFFEYLSLLRGKGYIVKSQSLFACWYEVPQLRERTIIIGVRKDINMQPVFPKPCNKIITLAEVIPDVIAQKIEQFDHSWESANKPAHTITKRRMFKIATKDGAERYPNIDELKKICSFPNHYILKGSYDEQWGMLGNAVPPKLMKHIALTVRKKIFIA